MNCNEIESLMADAVGDELAAEYRAAFEAHLAGCGTCRREYETLRGAMQAMRGLATPPRVAVRREGERLVISDGAMVIPARTRRPASAFRYAASVLIAFVAGYLLHAGLMFRDAGKATPEPAQIVTAPREPASPSLRDALVLAHQQSPDASDFTKLVMAMSERS